MTVTYLLLLIAVLALATLNAHGATGGRQDATICKVTGRNSMEVDTGGFLLWQPYGVLPLPTFPPPSMHSTPAGTWHWKCVGFAHCDKHPNYPETGFKVVVWVAKTDVGQHFTRFRRIGQQVGGAPSTYVDGPLLYQYIDDFLDEAAFRQTVADVYDIDLDGSNSNGDFERWELEELLTE